MWTVYEKKFNAGNEEKLITEKSELHTIIILKYINTTQSFTKPAINYRFENDQVLVEAGRY